MAKKRNKLLAIAAAAAAVIIAAVLIVTKVVIPKANYNRAVEYYGQSFVDELAALKVGDIYTFGTYEQDNNSSNGKEPIEWIVVDKTTEKNGLGVMLVSKYALSARPYNTESTSITWENCTLRTWLNDIFLNEAFNADEQGLIQITKVTADKNPEYRTSPGNATEDKVFLLSIDEADKYFPSDEARMCAPTEYAKEQGTYTGGKYKVDGVPACWWWLRSPGPNQHTVARVDYDGSVYFDGYPVHYDDVCVRPAIWVSLEA